MHCIYRMDRNSKYPEFPLHYAIFIIIFLHTKEEKNKYKKIMKMKLKKFFHVRWKMRERCKNFIFLLNLNFFHVSVCGGPSLEDLSITFAKQLLWLLLSERKLQKSYWQCFFFFINTLPHAAFHVNLTTARFNISVVSFILLLLWTVGFNYISIITQRWIALGEMLQNSFN